MSMVIWLLVPPGELFDDSLSTVVFADDGTLLGAHISEDEQWRFPLIDSVPQNFVDAITTYEDKRFFKHPGFDILSIGRAIISNVKSGKVVSGASTLTMQTLRLSRKGQKRNAYQKVVEILFSLKVELHHTKSEILNLYASHAPFGGNVVGLETASWRYFQKSPDQLSISESAMLAVLPNAPSLIHISRNREKLKSKRNGLLADMLDQKLIDTLQYELALLEEIPDKPYPLPQKAKHLLTYLQQSNAGTSRHSTTINPDIQLIARDIADYHYHGNRASGIENIAILIADTWSGEVLAYVGNAPSATEESAVDMVMAPRSSGSILKPFLYAYMINEGLLTPNMLVKDIPTNISGFRPRNYDRQHRGALTAADALSQSLNIPAVNLLQQYKPERLLDRLQKLGLTTLDKTSDHYGLSLILGGGEVNLWQLCGAYASLGRILSRFTDQMSTYSSGDILPLTVQKRVVDSSDLYRADDLTAGAIYHTFQAMEQVNRPDQEGDWRSFSSRGRIAWKTGTSFGHRDAWAVGMNKKYTIGVWVGNADGEGINGLVGVKKAAPVLFDVVNRLHNDEYFSAPLDDLQPTVICRSSGHIASNNCQPVDTINLAASISESAVCPYHKLVHLDSEGNQVRVGCGDDEVNSVPWFVLPAIVESYYRRLHPEYIPLPPFDPDCKQHFTELPLAIIYPNDEAKIYLPKDLDGELEKIVAKATHKDGSQHLYWHLDDTYLGETKEMHSMDFQSSPGSHVLTIVDDFGNEVKQSFTLVGE